MRRTAKPLLRTSLLAIATLAMHQGVASAQTRRALVVGINTYDLPEPVLARWRPRVAAQWAATPQGSAPPGISRAIVPSLEGSVNDATAIAAVLASNYGFRAANVRVLLDSAATRAGIVAAIERLTQESAPGDVVVFYYAGHGAQRYNSLSHEGAKLDQTIVPADANAGQYDIRDKELARLFAPLVAKKVALTLIFDSCHSGSITRGETSPRRVRWAGIDPRDARDSATVVAPEANGGAIVLAAAQDQQLAEETDDGGVAHGAFTAALLRVLRTTQPSEPAYQVYQRVRAMLQSDGRRVQEPVLRGIERDRTRPLFGVVPGELAGKTTVALLRIAGDTAVLQAGRALGFGRGTEFRPFDAGRDTSVRLKVVAVTGMSSSLAVSATGRMPALEPGTLLVLDRWGSADDVALRTWVPASVASDELQTAAASFRSLRAEPSVAWVDDPTALRDDGRALYVVSHDAAGWFVQSRSGTTRLAAATAASVLAAIRSDESKLTARAEHDAAAARQAKPAGRATPRLFVLLPPTETLRRALDIGAGSNNDAVQVLDAPRGADYVLAGRVTAQAVEYAWVRPNATEESDRGSTLVVRTDWLPATRADSLSDWALRLARVQGWLTVTPPSDAGLFPYHLVLKNATTGARKSSGETIENERYGLMLVHDSAARSSVRQKRYVYVFVIDSHGKSGVLYPQRSAIEDQLPSDAMIRGGQLPDTIPLQREGPFRITEPFGVDTFVLVSSVQPIDADVFRFDGVRGPPEGLRGLGDGSLSALFRRTGSGSRAATDDPVPTNWSIERIMLRSRRQ